MKKIKDSIIDTFEIIENTYLNAHNFSKGIKTGITQLDSLLEDIKEESLITIGAKPGTRRPAFLLNLVEAFCSQNKTCLYFYGWGDETEFTTNLICMIGEIEKRKVISGSLLSNDWEKLAETANKIQNWSLYIGNSSDFEISVIEEQIKTIKPDDIFIDAIQFFEIEKDTDAVIYKLKELCSKYHTTVFVAADIQESKNTVSVTNLKAPKILRELSDKIILLDYDESKKGVKYIKATSVKPFENSINLEFELSGRLISNKSDS